MAEIEKLPLPTPPPSNTMNTITPLPSTPPLMRKKSSEINNSSSRHHHHHTHTIVSKPTLITVPPMRFLIMDAPRQSNLHLYIRECRKHGVTDLVRVCEPTYCGEVDLGNAGIKLHEMAYDDGTSPPREILERWLDLTYETFFRKKKKPNDAVKPEVAPVEGEPSSSTVAVHCVAGLGRAPVLVAIALVEFAGMDPVDAVSLLRRHRRGAINEKQLQYLERYKKFYKGAVGGDTGCACVIL